MQNIFEVEYEILDRGTIYPVKTKEIAVKQGGNMHDALRKELNKDRHAMDLSSGFNFRIINRAQIGWK